MAPPTNGGALRAADRRHREARTHSSIASDKRDAKQPITTIGCWKGLVGAALTAGGVLLGALLAGSAGAAGAVPPGNPSMNISASSTNVLTSINAARETEGVGTVPFAQGDITDLPVPEQVFIIVNEERIGRGLQPIGYMSAQLNAVAQQGANTASDPSPLMSLSGGVPVSWGGAIWAGGVSVLEADYLWMYQDGWGGTPATTSNVTCSPASSSGCWGHRDIILHAFGGCGAGAPALLMGAAYSSSGYAGGSIAAVMESTCGAPPSDATLTWSQVMSQVISPKVIGVAAMANGRGYWEATSNGAVAAFGQATDYGSMATHNLNSAITGIAATPDGLGYWLVAADGGIFSFGDARFYGSAGSLQLVAPIVAMSASPDGLGYWLVAADGGIFSFGDAAFHGSMGGAALNQPIVGMAGDPATGGYWLVAADGGIFSFAAPFLGSTGALHLTRPIVGMAALGDGNGYRFVAADGGVFCFGQAGFAGSMGGAGLVASVVGMAGDPATGGYWLVAADGGIFNFAAPFSGAWG